MLRVYTTHQITEDELLLKKDEICQKLVAYAKRLRRYSGSAKRKQQNNEFSRNEKVFYQKLDDVPDADHIPRATIKQ